MGCDIHTFVEIRRGDKWVDGNVYKKNQYYNEFPEEGEYGVVNISGRNYLLFTTLAGVRSTHDSNKPIDQPRGVPEDATDQYKKLVEDYGIDGHTHSWFTLKELKEYQETKPRIFCSGMITTESKKLLDEQGITPEMWCQATSMSGYVYAEWSDENISLVPFIRNLAFVASANYVWDDANVRVCFFFDN